jgi:hypothetical protein
VADDWGEDSGMSIGGVFDGSLRSEGSGARLKLGIDLPILPTINLVDAKVPGFRRGGVIPGRGPSRSQVAAQAAEGSRAKLAALHRQHGAPEAAGGRAPGRRQGGADAPTSGHTHAGGGGGARPAHGIGAGLVLAPGVGMAGRGGAGVRRRHEVAPGVPCPSCAAGITKPVR